MELGLESRGLQGSRSSELAGAVVERKELLYRCSCCKEEIVLEENAATVCPCGWRILTKTTRQTMRSYTTD
jgi:DNA-directed RNA polymerase subunit RPC12/RpoP